MVPSLDSLAVTNATAINQLNATSAEITGTSTLNNVTASGTTIVRKLNVYQYCGLLGGNCVPGNMLIKVAEKVSTWRASGAASTRVNSMAEWNQMFTDASAYRTSLWGSGLDSGTMTKCNWDSAESSPTASESDVKQSLNDCMVQLCNWHPTLNANGSAGSVGNLVVTDGFACGWPAGAAPNSGACTVGYYKIDCLYY
jgi:hypothetical protein